MQGRIDARRDRGFEASQREIRQGVGFQLSNQIFGLIGAMEAEEQTLLEQRSQAAQRATRTTLNSLLIGVPLYSVLLAGIAILVTRSISRPLNQIAQTAERVGAGDLSARLPETHRQDEVGVLTRSFNQMIDNLQVTTAKNNEQSWLKASLAEVTQKLQGQRDFAAVARLILAELAPRIGAQQGVFYLLDADADPPVLKLMGSYAYQERKQLSNQFELGEGLVGQCALEKQRILLTAPADYVRISSGLGEAAPLNIVVLPILFEEEVAAVLELASLQTFSEAHLTLLDQVAAGMGVILKTIAADLRTNQLLEQSHLLTLELQERQIELEASNQQLEHQTLELRRSEALLREQQEELQQTNEELQQLNEELEEKAELLMLQKQEVEAKNQELEKARQVLAEQTEQLALVSKYKSEFLANMSHELRTPLNSLLILARLLSENSEGNLSQKQVEYSRTIYSAGNDLLSLINDILDLAKIESGTMSLDLEPVMLSHLVTDLDRTFRQVALEKGLQFSVEQAEDLPQTFTTDSKRLQQILKNLLANAFKFTERGGVTLRIEQSAADAVLQPAQPPSLIFSVQDTGIGIAPEHQKMIFFAFQQADGTTSRKYGGTGLGLSISRELATLLGGRIELTSEVGQGSTFDLHLPLVNPSAGTASTPIVASASAVSLVAPLPTPIVDDRNTIGSNDRVLLIIEDDVNFAQILLDMSRQQGFKALVATQGQTGLRLAQTYRPQAIMLDIQLPDISGWQVLDQLKQDPHTGQIPVHILSIDEEPQRGLQNGATAYLQKPVSAEAITAAFTNIRSSVERNIKQLLIIEDDPVQAQTMIDQMGNGDLNATVAHTGQAALDLLETQNFDCVVLDLGLPDVSGFELLNQIKQQPQHATLPVIVYTAKDLTRPEETALRRFAETIIVKDVRSAERLLDATALFLHRIRASLPVAASPPTQADDTLADKTVLIVDDDVRNIFALTSSLEKLQMQVIYAENGRDGIQQLEAHPQVNVVLMDMMMPEMDGYETIRAIRQQERFRYLPIIALTAKAMQGDREKCIEAGASDYITKPVAMGQLLSLLRVWLYRQA